MQRTASPSFLFISENFLKNCGPLSWVTGLPSWLSGKESACQCWRCGFSLGVERIPGMREWEPTAKFLPGKSHGQKPVGSMYNGMRGVSSARGKGHEVGGLAYAKAGSSLRSLPGNSQAIYPQNQSLPPFCFVLSPTPLTLRGGCPPLPLWKKS